MKDTELDDFFTATVTEVEEAPATDTTEPVADEATVEDEPSEEAPLEVAEVEEPEQAKADPKMVPLTALHAERQKERDTRDELIQLRQEMAQLRQQLAPAPVQQPQPVVGQDGIPDPFDDPNSYHQYVMQQARAEAQQMFVAQQVQHSRMRAIANHGEDVVKDAADWFADQVRDNPALEAKALAQPDVAEWVIAQKKRSDALKDFEADNDAYVMRRAAELGLTAMASAVEVTPPAAKDTGPKSLVSAKSAMTSVSVKQTPADAFDALFNK